jgi:hypothetical protein
MQMVRICPKADYWNRVYTRLLNFAQLYPCTPAEPPVALVLGGWIYTNDMEKKERWEETIAWSNENGCGHLISKIPEDGYYEVIGATDYTIGPLGGPMYQEWDFEAKQCPDPKKLKEYLDILLSQWPVIAGEQLGHASKPLGFSGKKARRLVVWADSSASPPWGSWTALSDRESERRTFTKFRDSINRAIAPHAVDHIDFTHIV